MSMTSSPLRRTRAASTSAIDSSTSLLGGISAARFGERPAVILGMRDFEPARAKLDRKIDEGGDLMQIGAMDDRIDGERQAGLDHMSSEGALALP